MSDASTARMISAYMEEASAPQFLSSFFRSPPENFHESEFVEVDVERDTQEVAIALLDITTGARVNEASLFTNKRLKPPIFKEAGAISAFSSFSRQPGMDPFADVDYMAAATRQAFKIGRKLEKKIRRAIEQMASQVLTTGTITLTDGNGVNLYVLDYLMKANHSVKAATTWTSAGAGDPLTDLGDLATTIREHGKRRPDTLIFGKTALRTFFANTKVKAELDNRRIARGNIVTPSRARDDESAKFHGEIAIDNDVFEIWLYNGDFTDPVTGNLTPYVGDDQVIMLSSGARLDITYGGIPLFRPEERALAFLPQSLTGPAQGLGLTLNSWITRDNTALMVEAGSRPLVIPTAIDTFGVLNRVQA